MRQTSIKSDRVADLLDRLTAQTGETKVEAVARALEIRLHHLEQGGRFERTRSWLHHAVWSRLPPESRGSAPNKVEQEELLGL
jgi:hypothetical protein